MDQEIITLSLAVFGASVLQSATGIGFGIIAGPILLVVLNDNSAIQVSIVLNLLIASLLAPVLRQKADRPLLGKLLVGLAVGAPVGLLVFLNLDIVLLKVFAAVIVAFTLFMMLRNKSTLSLSPDQSIARAETVGIGFIAGVMAGSLAMPGPVPAAWMASKGIDKNTIRSTIFLMFVIAYAITLILQFLWAGVSADTLRLCASLAPQTIAGTVLGGFLSRHVSENVFHWLLAIILAATVILLLSTINILNIGR